ncbi:MAG: helix-turn-helix domain-containing protein [Rhodospirillales bacterium]|nr:helix-turn-helix domain-containing protein [Rhodospirillales bacterium]
MQPFAPAPCSQCAHRADSVCNAIAPEDLDLLARIAGTARAGAGESIIPEGAPAAYFFNLTEGHARLFKSMPDGRRQITGFAGPGDFLGLAASSRYAFGAEAIDAVQFCRFPRAALETLCRDRPALGERLLGVAAHELAAAQAQMLLLGRKTAEERIASFLIRCANDGRPCGHLAADVTLAMSRTDIADYLGLTIETVSRTLTKLRRQGLIDLPEIQRIVLTDGPALMRLATGRTERH